MRDGAAEDGREVGAGGRTSATVDRVRALTSALEAVDSIDIPAVLAHLANAQCRLTMRLLEQGPPVTAGEELLVDIQTAAKMLDTSERWLYRHHHQLPFARKAGRLVKFSLRGIGEHIRNHRSLE